MNKQNADGCSHSFGPLCTSIDVRCQTANRDDITEALKYFDVLGLQFLHGQHCGAHCMVVMVK